MATANSLDTKVIAGVTRALAAVGIAGEFRTYPSATEDKGAGEVTLGSAQHDAWTFTPPVPYDRWLVDGQAIEERDTRVLLLADGCPVVPEANERQWVVLDRGGADEEVFRIVGVTEYRAGNVPAAYELQLRR